MKHNNRFKKGDIVRLHTGESPQKVTQVHNAEFISTDYLNTNHKNHYRRASDFTHVNPKEDHKPMNTNAILVALLQAQRGMTTANVRISGSKDKYTYKVQPGMQLKPKDRVVVQCGATQKVAEVVEVHTTAQIDPEANFEYKWIIQKIDLGFIDAIGLEEEAMRHKFVQAELMQKLQAAGIDMTQIDTPALAALT